jgi:chromosomal replication initiation ATPase DnaA
MHQLPLDLRRNLDFSQADFKVSKSNQALFEVLCTPKDWLNPHLLLIGPEGSGKTHAGQLFQSLHQGLWLGGNTAYDDLDFNSLGAQNLIIETADHFNQETLFHLFNATQANNGRMILLSRLHPKSWAITLPDFDSRLKSMRLMDMPEPDDDLLKSVLKSLFERRAITPPEDLLEYLSRRMNRNLSSAQKIVTELEDYANGRAFTRVLAREYLDKLENLSWLTDWDDK